MADQMMQADLCEPDALTPMSDDKKKPDEKPAEKAEAPKKSGGMKGIFIVVFVCISSTVGAVFGQVALARMKPEKEKPDAAYEEKVEPLAAETIALESIIVDLRTSDGEVHRRSVIGVALEISKPIPEEEQKKLSSSAREGTRSSRYMRSLTYDQVIDREALENIRIGARRAHRKSPSAWSRVAHVLFTEFVVQ